MITVKNVRKASYNTHTHTMSFYVVLIGDVRKSRKIKNRKIWQKKFINVIENLNNEFADVIVSKFVVTLGDEFQGILYNNKKMMDIISYIDSHLSDVSFRYGIGIGDIITDINCESAIGADGSAFHAARDAINFVKKSEENVDMPDRDIAISMNKKYRLIDDINFALVILKVVFYNIKTKNEKEKNYIINENLLKYINNKIYDAGKKIKKNKYKQ